MDNLLHDNRTVLKDVIRAQGQALATAHDLSFKLEKGSFNRGQFRMILKFGVPDIEAEMHQEFVARWLPAIGLPENIFGQTYESEGIRYTVVDIDERLEAKCVRVVHEGTTSPRYKVSPRKVREALGIPEPQEEAIEDHEPVDEADV